MHPRGTKKGVFWVTPDAPQSLVFRELGRDQQIVCLRAPAQVSDRPPLTLHDLAVYYAESIDEFSRDDPVTLVGYCIAGVLAREIAIQLDGRGRPVKSLIMIDPPDPAESRIRLTRDPLGYRLSQQARRWEFHLRQLFSLKSRHVTEYLRGSVGGIVARLNYRRSRSAYAAARSGGEALSDEFNDSYHVAVAAFQNSIPEPYGGSALMIRPSDVPHRVFEYSNLRWRELIRGGIQFIDVPGNSSTMWQEPAVKVLSNAIRDKFE